MEWKNSSSVFFSLSWLDFFSLASFIKQHLVVFIESTVHHHGRINNSNRKSVVFFPILEKLQHIMFSYQWDVKIMVIKLRQKLKHEGYRVWIDIEQMCKWCNSYRAMRVDKLQVWNANPRVHGRSFTRTF